MPIEHFFILPICIYDLIHVFSSQQTLEIGLLELFASLNFETAKKRFKMQRSALAAKKKVKKKPLSLWL